MEDGQVLWWEFSSISLVYMCTEWLKTNNPWNGNNNSLLCFSCIFVLIFPLQFFHFFIFLLFSILFSPNDTNYLCFTDVQNVYKNIKLISVCPIFEILSEGQLTTLYNAEILWCSLVMGIEMSMEMSLYFTD